MMVSWVTKEMARRYVQFHSGEPWDSIELFGLFHYSNIKKYLKDGRLINHLNYVPENKIWWVIPSKDYWENHILPEVRLIYAKDI